MRYVVAVAETRNFTRAAERCEVVQSSLSHRIAGLERELGVRLFARTSRRVELTSAGEAFVAAARDCLAAADRAAADAAAATGVVRGRLAVGVIVTTAAVDVPELLQRYRARHPQVRVDLRSGRSDDLAAAVRDGKLDIAFLGLPESQRPTDVEALALDHDRHALLVPADHPLAHTPQVTLREITDETFVTSSPAPPPAPSPTRRSPPRAWSVTSPTRPEWSS